MKEDKPKLDMPSTDEIIEEALDEVRKKKKLDKAYVRKNFSEVTDLLFATAYGVYLRHEKAAQDGLRDSILRGHAKDSFSKDDVRKMIDETIARTSSFEKSLKQSRAARAGRSLEIIVMRLLDILGIPNEHITKEDEKSDLRRIDIVVPDRKTAIRDPDKAKFLSLKTSLKDRWKLVIEDKKPDQTTYLITLLQREKLTKEVAEKIGNAGVFTYVPDAVKTSQFTNNSRVRRLSDLPDALD